MSGKIWVSLPKFKVFGSVDFHYFGKDETTYAFTADRAGIFWAAVTSSHRVVQHTPGIGGHAQHALTLARRGRGERLVACSLRKKLTA